MYRQYEDPRKLEEQLKEAEKLLEEAQKANEDMDRLVSLHENVEELRQRVNFAWQDEEFDMD